MYRLFAKFSTEVWTKRSISGLLQEFRLSMRPHGVVITPETVQASANVTIESEYEVVCDLLNGVIFNGIE